MPADHASNRIDRERYPFFQWFVVALLSLIAAGTGPCAPKRIDTMEVLIVDEHGRPVQWPSEWSKP